MRYSLKAVWSNLAATENKLIRWPAEQRLDLNYCLKCNKYLSFGHFTAFPNHSSADHCTNGFRSLDFFAKNLK